MPDVKMYSPRGVLPTPMISDERKFALAVKAVVADQMSCRVGFRRQVTAEDQVDVHLFRDGARGYFLSSDGSDLIVEISAYAYFDRIWSIRRRLSVIEEGINDALATDGLYPLRISITFIPVKKGCWYKRSR